MKTALMLVLWLIGISTLPCKAQELEAFNHDRLRHTKTGMLVLGGWAAANIITSPILANNASGNEKYFHQMNGYWNGVNLIIAGIGYRKAIRANPADYNLAQSLKEQQKIERALWINAGLDVVYVAAGLYLIEIGKTATSNTQRFQGFGQSIALQGSFLFAFDLVFYVIHKNNGSRLLPLSQQLSIHPSGFQLIWKI